MYSRVGHEQSHLQEDNEGRPPPPLRFPEPYEQHAYNGAGYAEEGHYGDVAHGRYSQYDPSPVDTVFSPAEHHQAYYHETYQAEPQDIPLIPRQSIPMPQSPPMYDERDDRPQYLDHRASRSTFHTFDPRDDRPPFLQHQPSHEAFQEELLAPAAAAARSADPTQHTERREGRLFRGNLVLDCPVPPKLLKMYPSSTPHGRDEFTHMRYTAATCDPADYTEDGFTVRQPLFSKARKTELMIIVTMYNENDVLFARTMTGVFENIEYMCSGKGKLGGSFGKDGWKNIVVCVVSDGRTKLDDRTKALLTSLGVFQDDLATQEVNSKPVTAHIYEYTTRVGLHVTKEDMVQTKPGGLSTPVQMLFCLKENNCGKLNSHRWAFSAFGKALGDPNICVLLDAGTRPGPQSIYQLYRAFLLDPNCGGACGEIKAMLGKNGRKVLNPIVATQNFEYKMSNLLDKPMESAFGFISVLPGAFSAYRYVALQNNKDGIGPLEKYFAGEFHHENAGIFTKNMYLAEDRILCFELVAKRNASWVLTYVKSAIGETDVPETMVQLIKQRRRWLNGSFFAAVYAQTHFYQIFFSSHSFMRKVMFMVEFLFQLINMFFAWFAIANFFLVFQILTTSLGSNELLGRAGQVIGVIIEWIYFATLVTCFVLSLGNKPDASKKFYMACVYIFGTIMLYLTFACIVIPVKSVKHELANGKFTFKTLFEDQVFFTLIISLLSTYVLWIFISVVSLDAWHIVTSSFQYFLLSPAYINVINVFAFCNVHDVSWGTRPPEAKANLPSTTISSDGNVDAEISSQDLDAMYDASLAAIAIPAPPEVDRPMSKKAADKAYYRNFRSYVVLAWMFCNAALVAIILKSGGIERLSTKQTNEGATSDVVRIYLLVVLWSVAGLSGFKFVGATWYLIHRIFKR